MRDIIIPQELYKQGHHPSVLQSSLSGIIEQCLLEPFRSSSSCSSSPTTPPLPLSPVAPLLFVCQITAPSVFRPIKRRLLPCSTCVPELGQYKAIRGNVKQPRVSAYIGLTVTQSASTTPLLRETNNGAIFRFRAVKTEGPISLSLPLSSSAPLHIFLSVVLLPQLMDTLMCHGALKLSVLS